MFYKFIGDKCHYEMLRAILPSMSWLYFA